MNLDSGDYKVIALVSAAVLLLGLSIYLTVMKVKQQKQNPLYYVVDDKITRNHWEARSRARRNKRMYRST